MNVFVTGVAGQLGHDVMNELDKRGYVGIGSDIAPQYSGVADGSAVTTMPYVQLDITDAAAVKAVLAEVKPDVVVHCAAWTAVDLAEDEDKILAKKVARHIQPQLEKMQNANGFKKAFLLLKYFFFENKKSSARQGEGNTTSVVPPEFLLLQTLIPR